MIVDRKYYNIIKEIIIIRLNDGFSAEEIRNQLITGSNIGLVGIESKLNTINETKDQRLKNWLEMEVKETIRAINDIIPVVEVVTGEAIYNNDKKVYSYVNNYKYEFISKEEGYINNKIVLNLNNQENFRIDNKKVKSFITDGKSLYHVINNI